MSGVVLGALAGVGFGMFQAFHRRVNAVLDVYRATLLLLTIASTMLIAIALLTQDVARVFEAPFGALLAFAGAGFVHFFLGYTFLSLSQQRIGASRTGAMLGTMPLFGALGAALAFGERLPPLALLPVAVVVAGVAAVTLGGRPEGEASHAFSITGFGFGAATALCWSTSPLLIRVGLMGLDSPLLGVAVGMLATTLTYALVVAARRSPADGPAVRSVLRPATIAAAFVGFGIWCYWTALDLAEVGIVLAVVQLSTPTVAFASPLVSGDPMERGGTWFWVGIALIVGGSLVLILGNR